MSNPVSENRSEHLKVYVEPSVLKLIKRYQIETGAFSISDATRSLILFALSNK